MQVASKCCGSSCNKWSIHHGCTILKGADCKTCHPEDDSLAIDYYEPKDPIDVIPIEIVHELLVEWSDTSGFKNPCRLNCKFCADVPETVCLIRRVKYAIEKVTKL